MPRNRVAYLAHVAVLNNCVRKRTFSCRAPCPCITGERGEQAAPVSGPNAGHHGRCGSATKNRRAQSVPRRARTVAGRRTARSELTRLDEEEPETIEQHRSEERGADTQA